LTQTLEFLAEIGVPTVGLNALIYSGRGLTVNSGLAETELPTLLNLAREITTAHNQRLIWYTPTQYCNFDPMQLELGVKGCTAALYNMCVEPNGDVIPCQSYPILGAVSGIMSYQSSYANVRHFHRDARIVLCWLNVVVDAHC
jgi:MoaA/NifB/PqqE/SkfB family radical SAM enzyme